MSLKACIWALRALIWSGVNETGVWDVGGNGWVGTGPEVTAEASDGPEPFVTAWPFVRGCCCCWPGIRPWIKLYENSA
jgi:hypothetical protein